MSGDLTQSWTRYLRKQSKGQEDPKVNADASPSPSPLQAPAATTTTGASQPRPAAPPRDRGNESAPGPGPGVIGKDDDQLHSSKRLKSPTASVKTGEQSPSPTRRSRARQHPTASEGDYNRTRPQTVRTLWTEDRAHPTKTPNKNFMGAVSSPSSQQPRWEASRKNTQEEEEEEDDSKPVKVTEMVKQPETRPISQEQLVAEVKGIYAGLVMVESKCIDVDNAQNAQNDTSPRLNNEQWQALIALHRTLLHEHHDFFLASQHPSASPALRRLASKYAMPARMWRHGIHSFLELLRHRLPQSLEHMLTFIYLAYSMMALLYETVPAFEDTWIECLGDLGRYRMAIEDDDIRDREVWTAVSRHWYAKASDKAPTTGRLYHHLAILARPNAVQQLYYYTKSLCCAIPFNSARESILTLFDPILSGTQTRLSAIDTNFIKTHGMLFSLKQLDEVSTAMEGFLSSLDNHIARTTKRWMESGGFIAICNSNGLLGYAAENNIFMKILSTRPQTEANDASMEGVSNEVTNRALEEAQKLTNGTDEVVFGRYGDPNVLPYVHVRLCFIHYMADFSDAMTRLEQKMTWVPLVQMLNSISTSFTNHDRIEAVDFPKPIKGEARALPEDWSMRGLLWTDKLLPPDLFVNDKVDDDEKTFEIPSMLEDRQTRILWLAHKISLREKWFTYDKAKKLFAVTPEFQGDVDMALDPTSPSPSRSSTFASATTVDRTPTWASEKDEELPDADVDIEAEEDPT